MTAKYRSDGTLDTNAMALAEATANPNILLMAALEHVESASIRAWVETDHNRPIFLQLAAGAIQSAGVTGRHADPHLFAAYIVATAIGL